MMKACVIIPTYNEAKEIARIVREIKDQGLDVLVIDDGSTDNTYQLAKDNGAFALKNSVNQGKGASLIKGYNYALERAYDIVITLDGDGQHPPEHIPQFIRSAQDSKSGIIIGNRMGQTKDMPFIRTLTNRFMSWLISILTKQKIPDTQCGFRLIKRDVLEKVNFSTSKYETETEILIKAARLGYSIESVPIKTVYSGEESQINPFIDTLRFFRYVFREIWTT